MLLQSDVFIWNEQRERLGRADLQALQLKQLNSQSERVSKSVAHYRQAMEKAGIKAGGFTALADIERLPFTCKTDLRDNYPVGLLSVEKSELKRLHASSGTRGKPTIAAYTKDDLSTWAELVARCLSAIGVRPCDVLQNAYGYGLFTGGLGLHAGAELMGAAVVPSSSGRTQQQVMLLQDLEVTVLCCTPSYALNIAATMAESNVTASDIKLRLGLFGAEPWSSECRGQIEKSLGIKAYDIYGLSEIMGPGVAVECLAQDGLHIWEDHFLVEVIDAKTLQPLPEGEAGELVLTTLSKQASPLFRYRTGDMTRIIEKPCECGRTARRIARFQGRIDDMLIVRGVNVYPSEIESVLLSMSELSPQYQIVIDRAQSLDQMKVRAELSPHCSQKWQTDPERCPTELKYRELETRIATALRERLGLTAAVELLAPDTLPRSEGKAHHVLDMRGS